MNHIFLKLDKKEKMINTKVPMFIPILIAIFIIIMKKCYGVVNEILTNNENHEKQISWDNSYTLKKFIFEIINCYYCFYYILFVKNFKGKCVKHDNCFHDLRIQLRAIILSELINVILEIGIP